MVVEYGVHRKNFELCKNGFVQTRNVDGITGHSNNFRDALFQLDDLIFVGNRFSPRFLEGGGRFSLFYLSLFV